MMDGDGWVGSLQALEGGKWILVGCYRLTLNFSFNGITMVDLPDLHRQTT